MVSYPRLELGKLWCLNPVAVPFAFMPVGQVVGTGGVEPHASLEVQFYRLVESRDPLICLFP